MPAIPPPGASLARVDVDAGSLAVWHRPGPGQLLVMLHGNTSSKEAFRPLFECDLLDGTELVALDLPGAGESDNATSPERDYTIPGLANAVTQALTKLDLGVPILLGWSLGGHIAIEAVAQGLDAQAIVLTGTPPCGPGAAEVIESFNVDELFAVGTSLDPDAVQLDRYIAAVFGRPIAELPEALVTQARCFDGHLRATFGEHWLAGTSGHNQRAVVANWARPIAAISGENELFYDPAIIDSLTWANLWRGCGQLIEDAGHAPFFEKPEVFGHLLREFIADIKCRPQR